MEVYFTCTNNSSSVSLGMMVTNRKDKERKGLQMNAWWLLPAVEISSNSVPPHGIKGKTPSWVV